MIFLGRLTLDALEFGDEGTLLSASSTSYVSAVSARSIPETICEKKF
jgi:hypothetical protein